MSAPSSNLGSRSPVAAGGARRAAALTAVVGTMVVMSAGWLGVRPPAHAGALAQQGAQNRRVVVIMIDRTGADHVAASTGLQGLAARGAAGLIATPAASDQPLAAAATLAAGERAVGPVPGDHPRAVQPGPTREETPFGTLGELYRARVGGPPGIGLVYPDVGLLLRLNAEPDVGAAPSLLGETLRQGGIGVAAIGNSDLPDDLLRPAPIVAMDAAGRVPQGTTATTLEQRNVLPVVTDLELIQAATQRALDDARLLIVDWGDTARIDRLFVRRADRLDERDASGVTMESRLNRARAQSLRRLDDYIAFVEGSVVIDRDVVVVVSPTPPTAVGETGIHLAPIIASGAGLRPGALTSDLSGHDGVVTPADLTASILSWLGVPRPSGMEGRPMEVVPEELPLQAARDTAEDAAERDRQRPVVLGVALLLWAATVAAGLAVLEMLARRVERADAAGKKRRGRHGVPRQEAPLILLRGLLFAAALLPVVLLVLGGLSSTNLAVALIVVLVVTLGLGLLWAAAGRRRMATGLGTIGGVVLALLLLDRLTGGALTARSWTGPPFWSAEGPYSKGHLLTGVLAAAVVLLSAALLRAFRRSLVRQGIVLGAAVAVLVFLALPAAGVRFPGTIVGLVVLGMMTTQRRLSRRVEMVMLGVLAVLLAARLVTALIAGVADARMPEGWPVGGSAGPAAAAALAWDAVTRAASLLFFSPWTLAIALSLAAMAYTLRRARGPTFDLVVRGRAQEGPFDLFVEATLWTMGATAAVAVLASVAGAGIAGVVLMAATLLTLGAALDRVRVNLPRRA